VARHAAGFDRFRDFLRFCLFRTRRRASSITLSSEVDIGSREENASKQESKTGSDSIRTDQALAEAVSLSRAAASLLT
jgi:hypothetical protein